MIEQGSKLFDELIVAVGTNPEKKYLFTVEERIEMLKEIAKDFHNVTVAHFEGKFLVDFAREVKANYILRGIGNIEDYRYEKVMRNINSDLAPEIVTVFLMPPRELAEVSSSIVKSLIGFEGWENVIKRYVPEPVLRKLIEKYGQFLLLAVGYLD
jgi:pantetheine-phosphate adenylyltransferase